MAPLLKAIFPSYNTAKAQSLLTRIQKMLAALRRNAD
jgi:hypothetical protein